MSRLLVFVLVFSLGHSSVALAGGTLLASGIRITRRVAETPVPTAGNAVAAKPAIPDAGLQSAQAQPDPTAGGMRKRTKVLVGLAATVAFVGGLYLIDHGVEDNTPSSLGKR